MDYTTISCGVAGQENPISKEGKEKILSAICELLKNGYRRFLIALTGEATLTFAEGVLSALEQYQDAGIDILIPFDGWIEEQADSARYRRIMVQSESVHYSCDEDYEDSTDICNRQLIGFGGCTVIIHDTDNKAMQNLAMEILNADQKVREIRI